MAPSAPDHDFARVLYSELKGSSLWLPSSPGGYGLRKFDGIQIGDIYLHTGEIGVYMFNVTLPTSHPRNEKAPKDHLPVLLEPIIDVTARPQSYPPHTLLGTTNDPEKPLRLIPRYVACMVCVRL